MLSMLGERGRNIDYTHRPLAEQLSRLASVSSNWTCSPTRGRPLRATRRLSDRQGTRATGTRAAEPGFKVLHTQDLDYRTTCSTLKGCLTIVRDWSRAYPWHVPIMIMIEAKDAPLDDPDGVGFVKPTADWAGGVAGSG